MSSFLHEPARLQHGGALWGDYVAYIVADERAWLAGHRGANDDGVAHADIWCARCDRSFSVDGWDAHMLDLLATELVEAGELDPAARAVFVQLADSFDGALADLVTAAHLVAAPPG